LERIVQASLDILEREGPEALTVQSIVDRAGSSVGSFYARFRGKDDLLDYLGERVWREAAGRWDEALASRDWGELELAELAEGSARLLLDMERSRASYLKALDRVPGGRDGGYGAFRAHLLEGLEAILLTRRAEVDHLDPVFAVRVGLRAVLGVVDALDETAWQPPAERLVHECRELLVSYLQPTAERSETPPGQVDFFDIWG
jgi:AcrR family transcriptional regulator